MKSKMGIMFVKNSAKYVKGIKLIDLGHIVASVGILMVGAGSLKLYNSTDDEFTGDDKELNELKKAFNTVYENPDKHIVFGVHSDEEK